MPSFTDLPIELLPLVVEHIFRPSYLAKFCLVNRVFQRFATPLLYQQLFIYAWHKDAKAKVVRMFKTLAGSPYLGAFVQKLVIRDFPRALLLGERSDVLDICLRGIRNCVNLQSCTWTRDGSLSTEIFETLQELPHLSELEINGHSQSQYKADILIKFTALHKISIIMPSLQVLTILPEWVKATSHTLRQLSLICKGTSRVTDSLLADLAPDLRNLRQFYLVGCPKVTHEGFGEIVSASSEGLVALGIEGVSHAFDMVQFGERCTNTKALRNLQSVTLTVHAQTSLPEWTDAVVKMLSTSPLQRFHISTVGGEIGRSIGDEFCSKIIDSHGERLTRFSVHRMRISLDAVKDICRRCVVLEELFIVVEQESLETLGDCLSHARQLRILHINRPLAQQSDEASVVPADVALGVAKACGSEIHQIGFNTRVWQVAREADVGLDGTLFLHPKLEPYEHPEIPEQFLVVRT